MISNNIPAIETFVSKLSNLNHSNVIIRGSFVTRHWAPGFKRGCQDVDLLINMEYNFEQITDLVLQILRQPVNSDVHFNESTLQSKAIWENSPAPGIRFTVKYTLENELGELQIDTGVGDPLVCESRIIEIHGEFLKSSIKVRSVVPEIAVAWKIHGLFEHLTGWMSKTLWDIYILIKSCEFDPVLLKKAVYTAFESRSDSILILRRLLYGSFGTSRTSRKSWQSFIEKVPESKRTSINEVLSSIRIILIPILKIENDDTLLTQSDVLQFRITSLREDGSDLALNKLKTLVKKKRIQNWKAYDSIPHLPESRTGPADRHIPTNKAEMLTSLRRNTCDEVFVQEKLDGSCVAVAKVDGEIHALGREGSLASESLNAGRRLWAEWVELNKNRFDLILAENERIVGEWLALVHSTRYDLIHEPFVAFDIFSSTNKRINYDTFLEKCKLAGLKSAALLHRGEPISVNESLKTLGEGQHNSIDAPEGVIYRLERFGKFLFMAKYVRHGKIDGEFLPENNDGQELWNWREL